jgi:hypothetical protein
VTKSKSIRWEEHVAIICERRIVYRILVDNRGERGHMGDPRVDGNLLLKSHFRK